MRKMFIAQNKIQKKRRTNNFKEDYKQQSKTSKTTKRVQKFWTLSDLWDS